MLKQWTHKRFDFLVGNVLFLGVQLICGVPAPHSSALVGSHDERKGLLKSAKSRISISVLKRHLWERFCFTPLSCLLPCLTELLTSHGICVGLFLTKLGDRRYLNSNFSSADLEIS